MPISHRHAGACTTRVLSTRTPHRPNRPESGPQFASAIDPRGGIMIGTKGGRS